ncbi:MAG TPA: aconitate hydratase, partial [Streptosporangiaceae bacterium]
MPGGSFGSSGFLNVDGAAYRIFRLDAIDGAVRLPFSLKILLENLLRNEDGRMITAGQIQALAGWDPAAEPSEEIGFTPARVLMQDFTGVPCIVDLAAMREAMTALGGAPARISPLRPAELIIDHSVIADHFGQPGSLERNIELEYQRNRERYQFLRWGQGTFRGLRVVPPGTGICHQVNIEHLARVVFAENGTAFPDTLVGTDSHTPMVNGLGVLGWGVGGIEAEAAMLGQPVSMLIPRVVGVRLSGELPDGSTATDLVLTITEALRATGVVGTFVEFYGPGVAAVPVANRATIGNMSPEYGSTCAIFPIDTATLSYLRLTGRPASQIALVEAYAKEQGLWHEPGHEPAYSQTLELDLSRIVPSIAGPKRPQDRIPLAQAPQAFRAALQGHARGGTLPVGLDASGAESFPASDPVAVTGDRDGDRPATFTPAAGVPQRPRNPVRIMLEDGQAVELDHGAVVIAAITSCTNTSNPDVMIGAALLAKKAHQRGLAPRPWVKTSLAPGSRVVTDYYDRAGLTWYLDKLGFNVVGYGCTTCIGNSGPLIPAVSAAVTGGDLAVCAVLSGNRNFEGRIHPQTKMNYLASPPLVVAYALAGSMDTDLTRDPLGTGSDGQPVYLRDIWPSPAEIAGVIASCLQPEMFTREYAAVFAGDERWQSLATPAGDTFTWEPGSTYVRRPPYFEEMDREPGPLRDIDRARVLALLGDSVTTDHISPAGTIRADSPAGRYLTGHGVQPGDFNSYGSRRGNHEVMIRGTFANIRLRNQLAPGTEGGYTRHLPSGDQMTIFDAATRYAAEHVPLLVIAGQEYGSGSSRDWAAKGTALLGVRAVIATSFERIHRSNLIGMGVLPLQFPPGADAASLGLSGEETFTIHGLAGQAS